MTSNIKVLIVSAIPTHFREMRRVAHLLKTSGRYHPVIFFQQKYLQVHRDIQQCIDDGVDIKLNFINDTNIYKKIKNSVGRKMLIQFGAVKIPAFVSSFDWLISAFSRILFFTFARIWHSPLFSKLPGIRKIKDAYHRIQNLFDGNEVGLVVLPEDNLLYLTPFYIACAKARGVPVLVVPFTIANTHEFAETFYPISSYHADTFLNSLVARLFPKWVMRYKERDLIFPPQYILAYELLKLSPAEPWILNGGDITALMVESAYMKGYYLASGIKEERLHLTGALYDDALAQGKQYSSGSSEKPILLCALPPDQFNLNRPDLEFDGYADLIRYLFEILSLYQDRFQVIINLHPRSEVNDALRNAFPKLIVSSEDVANLIPSCHLYLAFSSATIRMAIALGVPVVNYDVYHYVYSDFKAATGVLEVSTRHDFETALVDLCLNREKYSAIKKKQELIAPQWGMLDGKSGERMLAMFDGFCVHPSSSEKVVRV